jgi:hypothetical protein
MTFGFTKSIAWTDSERGWKTRACTHLVFLVVLDAFFVFQCVFSFPYINERRSFQSYCFPSSLIIQFEFVRACSLMRWPSGLDHESVWVAWMWGELELRCVGEWDRWISFLIFVVSRFSFSTVSFFRFLNVIFFLWLDDGNGDIEQGRWAWWVFREKEKGWIGGL